MPKTLALLAALHTAPAPGASHLDAPHVEYRFDATISDVYAFTPLLDGLGNPAGDARIGLSGFIATNVVPGAGVRDIHVDDILDFDIGLVMDETGGPGSLEAAALAELFRQVRFTTSTTEIVLPHPLTANADKLLLGRAGAPDGTPYLQLIANDLGVAVDFPDGRRFGDDSTDTVLVSLFSGSVNLGVALLPRGFAGPPSLSGFGMVSASDVIELGEASGAPGTPVPLPLPWALLLSALALVGAGRGLARPRFDGRGRGGRALARRT